MKRQQVMALLLSSTLTIANVTPALAADTSSVAVTTEAAQEVTDETETPVMTEETEETADASTDEEQTEAPETENAAAEQEAEATPQAVGDDQSAVQAGIIDIGGSSTEEKEPLAVNEEFEENYLNYKVTGDKEVTVFDHDIREYWDDLLDIVVEPTVEHDGVTYKVVSVAEEAFMDDWTINSITFDEGITQIGNDFMGGAKNVSEVVFKDPNANMVVKDGCIYSKDMTRLDTMIPNYPIESYTTPDSVTVIGSRAIQSNVCKTVTLSDNVTTLENGATVKMPGIEVFNMGSGVTRADNGQFYDCDTLKELNIKGSFKATDCFGSNCPSLEKVTIDGNILGSATFFFTNCPKLKSFDVIQSSYQRSVDGVLFNGRKLMRYPAAKEDTSYYIPDGYTVSGQAFNHCQNLKNLYIGRGVALSAGIVDTPAQAMDVYLLDTNEITIGVKSSYLFCDMPKGSHIYCASEDRMAELNAYDKVAASDDGNLPEISVKRLPYASASFGLSEKVELVVGQEEQHLASNLTPIYANDNLVYESSDDSVCTVSDNGTVKGMKEGNAKISVFSETSGALLDTYEVHVSKASVKSIAFDKTELNLTVKGGSQKLNLTFDPADSETADGLVWKSDNTNVATVKDGVVTPVGTGVTYITATIQGKTAKCEVHVTNPLESIALDKTDVTMNKGDSADLNLVLDPENTSDDTTASWESSNRDVVTVKDGKLTAVGGGTATVTVKVGKFTATCEVTVKVPLEGLDMDKTHDLELGATDHLRPRFNPWDATADYRQIKWTTSDPKVVSINESGDMTGVSYGTATITATLDGVTATCEVTVVRPGLDKAEITMDQDTFTYDGTEKYPKVTVKLEGKTLKEDVDYQIGYYDNVNVGTASFAIRALSDSGNHGMAVRSYTIKAADLGKAEVSGITNRTFSGSAQTQSFTVKIGNRTLKEGTDYTVAYKNNTNAGTATVTLTGKGNYAGSLSKNFNIAKVSIKDAQVSGIVDKDSNGAAQTQNVTVKVNGRTLGGNDYTVSYSNNVQPGTATVTITGKGNYEGTISRTFNIKATGQWIRSGSRWWYRHNDGGYTRNGWEVINGQWYFFDNAGWMVTGWLSRPSGWYYLTSSGAMATGWLNLGGTWYYMNPSDGRMLTGWYQVNGTWYYSNASGAMQTGWLHTASGWYYLTGSGAMATGWINVRGTWYYMNPSDGHMQTGWVKVNGTWYYMNGSGAMLTGWQKIGNTWYYLQPSGAMAENTWVGNYYVDGSGAWVKTR